jgi:hypothetical protein
MSVLANTLNAYAGKIKAQRKAAERLAQAQARAKSQEQRQADKARIEAERLLKQAEANALASPTELVDAYIDVVLRKYKNEFGEVLVNGERAQITQDLCKIAELYYYQGNIPGKVAHKLIDTTSYSKTAFIVLASTLSIMKIAGNGHVMSDVVNQNMRRIMIMKDNDGYAALSFLDMSHTVDEVKSRFISDVNAGKTGVVKYFV